MPAKVLVANHMSLGLTFPFCKAIGVSGLPNTSLCTKGSPALPKSPETKAPGLGGQPGTTLAASHSH